MYLCRTFFSFFKYTLYRHVDYVQSKFVLPLQILFVIDEHCLLLILFDKIERLEFKRFIFEYELHKRKRTVSTVDFGDFAVSWSVFFSGVILMSPPIINTTSRVYRYSSPVLYTLIYSRHKNIWKPSGSVVERIFGERRNFGVVGVRAYDQGVRTPATRPVRVTTV